MRIVAEVHNSQNKHDLVVHTEGNARSLTIPPKATGFGSGVNGGELLFLALATCHCNDIYREAARRGSKIIKVDVSVEGDLGAEGEPARDVTYNAKVNAQATEREIVDLMKRTDEVAEIQNTLRVATPVTLGRMEAETV